MTIVSSNVDLPFVGFELQQPAGMTMYRTLMISGDSFYQCGLVGDQLFIVEYPIIKGGKPENILELNESGAPNASYWGMQGKNFVAVSGDAPIYRIKPVKCNTSLIEKILDDIVGLAAPELEIFLKILQTVDGFLQNVPVICSQTFLSSAYNTFKSASPLFNVKFIQPSGYDNPIVAAYDGDYLIFIRPSGWDSISVYDLDYKIFVVENGLLLLTMNGDYVGTAYLITASSIIPYYQSESVRWAFSAFDQYLIISASIDDGIQMINFTNGEYYPTLEASTISDYLLALQKLPEYQNLPADLFDYSRYGLAGLGQTIICTYADSYINGKTFGFRIIPDMKGGWIIGGFQSFALTKGDTGALNFYAKSGVSGWATQGADDTIWRINLLANPLNYLRLAPITAVHGGCRC